MSAKDKILKNIRKNISKEIPLKSIKLNHIVYEDKYETFVTNLKLAGGEISEVEKGVVIDAEFVVAENGACFIKDIKERKNLTYYEEITIRVDKNKILNNMQEAYDIVDFNDFCVFLSGASKTADIEQSLVIGAHGAKKT